MNRIADIAAGNADQGASGANFAGGYMGVFERSRGRADDMGKRIVGIGQDIGSTALAASEDTPIGARYSRAAASASAVDSQNVMWHGYLREKGYQKNTIYQVDFGLELDLSSNRLK
jgi:hypothetical protein